MKTKLQKITPAMAEKWLATPNTKNRKLRQRTVEAFAADMRRGKWHITHQGIAFDEAGNLLDGQHRLAAIVKSGCTIEMLVTTGLPQSSGGGEDDARH